MAEALYDTDILIWSEQQADLLARLAAGEDVQDQIDWEHVIDEVESVGLSELRDCEFLLSRSLMNLMRLASMPGDQLADEWRRDTTKWLERVRAELKPYIRRRIGKVEIERIYARALRRVRDDPRMSRKQLPDDCPFTAEDLLEKAEIADLLAKLGPPA